LKKFSALLEKKNKLHGNKDTEKYDQIFLQPLFKEWQC